MNGLGTKQHNFAEILKFTRKETGSGQVRMFCAGMPLMGAAELILSNIMNSFLWWIFSENPV